MFFLMFEDKFLVYDDIQLFQYDELCLLHYEDLI